MCNCNCKGRLIYRAELKRKDYVTHLKVYKDDYGNLTYVSVSNDNVINGGCLSSFDCKGQFPDVIQEVTSNETYEIDISVKTKKYFDKFLKTGSFNIVNSRSF
jgi:hypothetical protein